MHFNSSTFTSKVFICMDISKYKRVNDMWYKKYRMMNDELVLKSFKNNNFKRNQSLNLNDLILQNLIG